MNAQTQILTWHSDADLKSRVLKSYDGHIADDTLIKGEYFGGDDYTFKGCHIGCVVKELGGDSKGQYPKLTGLPDWLMGLNKYFFEHMPHPQNQKVTRDILVAIPVGKDISLVENRFLVWLLTDETHGSIKYCNELGKKATLAVAALHERVLVGDKPSQNEWAAAEDAAMDAAWAAAMDAAKDASRDAAKDASRDAAEAAAEAAAMGAAKDAAWAAAWAAAWDAAEAAAKDASMGAQAAKLIEILKAEAA